VFAHLLSKPVYVEAADGRKWRVVVTHRALIAIGEATGVDPMQVNLAKMTASKLRAVVHALIRATGEKLTLEQAGDIILGHLIAPIYNSVIDAWNASLAEVGTEVKVKAANKRSGKPFTVLDAWAEARYNLRLTDQEWLDMTPRMANALMNRYIEGLRLYELPIAIATAHNVIHSFNAPKKPVKVSTYMPHPWPDEPTVIEEYDDPGTALLAKWKGITIEKAEELIERGGVIS
jgi:hypothetical protein